MEDRENQKIEKSKQYILHNILLILNSVNRNI